MIPAIYMFLIVFTLYIFALDFVDEAGIMVQCGGVVSLAVFKWFNVCDQDYGQSIWIGGEEWFSDYYLGT